ncbi:J domain-containing protein [Candidatus Woesearchaeota archaeon]|nr:J domain-containing protein [Candidatus Woesearchaeota archaeon]
MNDYYTTLGVSRTATLREIRSAFRRIAQQCHPDKNKG